MALLFIVITVSTSNPTKMANVKLEWIGKEQM
jgi:hypothetical protein